jgi:geranylgeranyl reductase family protein
LTADLHFPVVISGAGPAGTCASLFLSQAGIRHLLVDKAEFPRDKICGDAVSGKMLTTLNKVHPEAVREFAAQTNLAGRSNGMTFVAPNGKQVNIAFPKSKTELPVGVISKRLDFDNFLFQLTTRHPEAEIWQEATVKEAGRENGEVKLQIQHQGELRTVRTPLVIAADGSRSAVKKKLMGEDMEDRHFSGGIRAYYQGVKGLHEEGYLELHFYKELLPGYLWIFPLPGGYANVGLGMRSDLIAKHRVNLRQKLTDLLQQHPVLRERFSNATLDGKIQGWGLPLGSRKRAISAENVILTGDAASLIDPFTGEGIGNAGISGMVAARTAIEAIKGADYSARFLKEYDKVMYQKLWRELQLSHTMQRLSTRPWLFDFVVNRIHGSKSLQEVFTNMFTDLELRAKLKSPLFYARLLMGK